MILGIIPTTSNAESLLNNLSEADFKLKDVSVIMRDLKLRNAIASDTGPFKGITVDNLSKRLVQSALSGTEIKTCMDALGQNKVLIVIACSPEGEKAASEMLKDSSAEFIKVVPK
jgi:hypothetical protein